MALHVSPDRLAPGRQSSRFTAPFTSPARISTPGSSWSDPLKVVQIY